MGPGDAELVSDDLLVVDLRSVYEALAVGKD